MRRLLSVLLSGVFLSGVLVAVDNQPASANAISLTFPSGDHRFSANEWESIATVTGTTPAVTGGTAGADIRVTVQAIDNGVLRLQVITDITAADAYNINDFDGDSIGLDIISFHGKVDKVSAALASIELNRSVTGSASIEVSVNEGTGLVIGDSYYEVYGNSFWDRAAEVALSKTLPSTVGGTLCQGYLVAITSKEEQEAIRSKIQTSSLTGGSDRQSLVNHSIDFINNNDSGSATYADQRAVEGKFHWVFGPERGSQISLDNGDGQAGEPLNSGDAGFPAGYPVSGQTNNGFLDGRDINAGLTSAEDANLRVSPAANHVFQNWNNKEPNNAVAFRGEDAIQMGADGLWNDFRTDQPSFPAFDYIVEFGGLVASAGHEDDDLILDLENLDHVGDVGACETLNAASAQTATFTAIPAAPAPVAVTPYDGPIITNLARVKVVAETVTELVLEGIRLNLITAITVEDKPVEIVSFEDGELNIQLPELSPGLKDMTIKFGSGALTQLDALNVVSPPEKRLTTSSDKKVNAGSFKGYVAVYAKGHEGKRLSAKIGKDWVIVDPIVNNESESLFRVTDFTGAGVDIQVRIFIDRELLATIPLTTR